MKLLYPFLGLAMFGASLSALATDAQAPADASAKAAVLIPGVVARSQFTHEIKDLEPVDAVAVLTSDQNRIVYFTVGDDECRSWAIDRDTHAVDAAGAIHTDLSKGFVRANVMSYGDFEKAGYEEKNCKATGTLRQESKEYIVKDGDIMHILANR